MAALSPFTTNEPDETPPSQLSCSLQGRTTSYRRASGRLLPSLSSKDPDDTPPSQLSCSLQEPRTSC